MGNRTFSFSAEAEGILNQVKGKLNISNWMDNMVKTHLGSIEYLNQICSFHKSKYEELSEYLRLRKKYMKETEIQKFDSIELEINAALSWWNRLIHTKEEMIFKLQKYNCLMHKKVSMGIFFGYYEKAEQIIKAKIAKGELATPRFRKGEPID